jgi:Type II secretion system (T2SS), protein G
MKANRVCVVALLLIVCGCGESKAARTRLELKNFDKTIQAYQAKNRIWPDGLEDLATPQPDGSEGYLAKSALVDPWGRSYQYDRNNRHPDNDQPLIWSEGPNPGESGSKIANWSPKEY